LLQLAGELDGIVHDGYRLEVICEAYRFKAIKSKNRLREISGNDLLWAIFGLLWTCRESFDPDVRMAPVNLTKPDRQTSQK
jgi:hypothetical protein